MSILRDSKPNSIELPEAMRQKLQKFQRHVWMVKLCEGLLGAVFGLLLSYLFVFTLDRFFETSAWVRGSILVLGAVGLAVFLPWMCHRWIWKSRRLEQVARLLKHRFPRFGDHLLGVIELVGNADEQGRSETLCRAALEQVEQETEKRDFSGAVPDARHKRWAAIVAVPAALVVLALATVPAAGFNAFGRWLTPWRQIDRYTFAQMSDMKDEIVVPLAEPSTVDARLKESTEWAPSNGFASLNGRTSEAKNQENRYSFQLPPVESDSMLNIKIGDARKSIKILPKARPELTSLQATVQLPEYLNRSQKVKYDVRGGNLNVVRGSQFQLLGETTRALKSAFQGESPVSVNGNQFRSATVKPEANLPIEFNWNDTLDLTSKTPLRLNVNVVDDEVPSLGCKQLERQQVVLAKDVISFQVNAKDDFGVFEIGMEWKGQATSENETAASGEKIVSAGGPSEDDMSRVATFSPKREGIEPQVLELRLFVTDYLPERDRVYSPTYKLYVVSEEDHAIWLTAQMDKWFKDSLDTYEKELQLFQENQTIRDLPAEQMESVATRRRIETQASAERAQARRLSTLTKLGAKLTQEATRNEQFNVQTLQKLAESIQALKDISEKRMPSVADLLKKASQAQGSSKPSPKAPSINLDKGGSQSKGGDKKKGDGEKADDKKKGTPSISMNESSMDEPPKEDEKAEPKPPSKGGGSLKLPTVTLQDNSKSPPQGKQGCPAQKKMEESVEEQEKLIAEFAEVAEELKKVLSDLEGSTFVKRLKGMSRKQKKLSNDVNSTTVSSFGDAQNDLREATQKRADLLAKRQKDYLSKVNNIQSDLAAYAERKGEAKFKTILKEMQSEDIVKQMSDVSNKITVNEPGAAIVHAELLADTFDRWAEQLVGPG